MTDFTFPTTEAEDEFLGDWLNYREELTAEKRAEMLPNEAKILFGYYTTGNYEGYAWALVEDKDGKLYEVGGSHCSCYGLEGQWDLDETSYAAMLFRVEQGNQFSSYEVDGEVAGAERQFREVLADYARRHNLVPAEEPVVEVPANPANGVRKVVINNKYGGFSLSKEANEALAARKGVEAAEDDPWQFDDIDRDDVDLVAVVEELGAKANGPFASLKAVEIPDDVQWQVEEYDGNEWIAEKHRIWG